MTPQSNEMVAALRSGYPFTYSSRFNWDHSNPRIDIDSKGEYPIWAAKEN
eukprot:CAMPEP_0168624096 /NCGR_PEP_ID=MMETSP0449_2-20121227/9212_1 /TAXON_ID=1082188 /ORGANISM="Strombidium rassoulzadegani, Strain ras09" /LENGTH=49 /DNA_ID=CAMNT_0008665593 /DNA_START=132 /DNA_END=281 /DNA_ORIENTATION=+